MATSIKSFLVLNLLLSVTLVSTLAIVGNLFLEHQGFQKNLDSELSLTAHTIYAFTSNNQNFSNIQKSINTIFDKKLHTLESIEDSIQYVIINNKNHKILLKSKMLPNLPKKKLIRGFHSLWIENRPWRIFSLQNKDSNITIYALQKHDFRASLEREITEDSFIIMFITYPFLGLLIWAVVNKGMFGIETATKLIKNRKRNNLTPLKIEQPPREIIPLIKAINLLLKRLDQAFQREQRFAADAAHELRTPLAALSAYLQLAQTEEDPIKIREYLKKVSHGVDRSSHVVDQLLTLSRMSPDAEINDPKNLNLKTLAKDIIIETVPHADKKNISLGLESSDVIPTILGNEAAILIMLRNLVDNAIRYSPKNSQVTLEILSNNNTVSILVADQGPGIPDDLKARVFERFYRVLGNKANGSGLGLGIVKQIVELHHAEIILHDNNPGLKFEVKFHVQK